MTKPARTMSSREFNQGTGTAKRAALVGPVYITDRGQPSHVLLSYQQYQELAKQQPNLADILCRTPGVGGVDLEIPPRRDLAEPPSLD